MRRLEEREAEAAAKRLERSLGPLAVEPDRPAIDPLGVEVAEDQVGVADRGLGAAEAVARRPGDGAGAPRPDLEPTGLVDPRDGAAAGADGLDGDRGQPHGVVAERPLARRLRHAVGDETDVGGGAAHVEGERARDPERAAEVRGGRDAGGGAGHRHPQRMRPGRVHGHHPARGVEEMERHRAGARRETGDQIVDVARRQRHHRRVEHRGAGALVLPELGVDLARDGHVGEVRGQRLTERLLVGRVRVGVKEADGDALDALAAEPLDDLGQPAEIERDEHRAVGADALADLGAEPPRHEGLGLGGQIEPVEVGAVHAPDLEHVAEAARRDETDGADAPLDDRVGDERGPVGERRAGAGHAPDGGEAVEHASGGVVGRRRHLERAHPPCSVPGHEVGEGAADVDAHA